ncbi:hypothetical protein FA10DRAFT_303563 [Acaromyces ingoldii]|uniref:RNI-like protein n=1 Tax=Acaromyces ingoldii TaxID=215250 RepID=A0A316YHI1_9BASI|nr:hypothetical protein FA10DRAFT_303563 [Acaromyces ingoldii]PWN88622.1 hypothetical protein FA10DRAFT_303563 [Acaromyces ingoldii]
MSVVKRPEPGPIMGTYRNEDLNAVVDYLSDGSEAIIEPCVFDLRWATGRPRGSSVATLLAAAKPPIPLPIRLARCQDDANGIEDGSKNDIKTRAIRQIILSGAHIMSFSGAMPNFMSLVRLHASLTSLDLQHSHFPYKLVPCKELAHAINTSVLRSLNMPNFYRVGGAVFVIDLINNLDCPSLETLYLNKAINLFGADVDDEDDLNGTAEAGEENIDMTQKEVQARVGDALAHLVSPWHIPRRGWAPNLKKLHLNANELGIKTVKRITRAILGQDRKIKRDGRISPPNRTLMSVEMLATYSDNSEDEAESDEEGQGTRSSAAVTASEASLRRVKSISSLLRERRMQEASAAAPTTPSSSAGDIIRVANSSRKPTSAQAGKETVTKENWRRLLGNHLWQNRRMASKVRESARRALPVVRVLGCCSREASSSSSSSSFPFTCLPAELRRRIVELLLDESDDKERQLTRQQMENVISFACERSTIGCGTRSAQLGMSDLALSRLTLELQHRQAEEENNEKEEADPSLIPHHRWSWFEMVRERSVPRDWPAAIIDESSFQSKSAYHGPRDDEEATEAERSSFGGGGGPDGQGGLTTMRPITVTKERKLQLWQTSGLRAFWEATGTTTALAADI